MKRSVPMLAAMLLLALSQAAQARPVLVEVAYLGHGQYLFRKTVYDYPGVVQAILATHQSHIDLVSVLLPAGASVADRRDVCHLKADLGTQLKMHLDVGDGTTQEQFCN
jgi:hypothetical protein